MTLTPWFPGDVKPVHIGVYQRDFGGVGNRKYAYWDGKHWRWSNNTPEGAAEWAPILDPGLGVCSPAQSYPSIRWRGLAEPA